MNMFRSLFFVAVATVVVSGSVSAVNGCVKQVIGCVRGVAGGLDNVDVGTTLVLEVMKRQGDLGEKEKTAITAAQVAFFCSEAPAGVLVTGATSMALGAFGESSYGKAVADRIPGKEYSATRAWLGWIVNIFVSVYLGDKVGNKVGEREREFKKHSPQLCSQTSQSSMNSRGAEYNGRAANNQS